MFERLSFFDTDHNLNTHRRGVKVLSCGAGMQSTALALMSVANKLIQDGKTDQFVYEERVPVYDLIIFCDLGLEPPWVYSQVEFIKNACESADIPFCIIDSHLYDDYIHNFGTKRVTSIPFWTYDEDGKKGKMMRNCTLDYKIKLIQNYVRWEILGYKKGQKVREEDIKAHEMHIGFSMEESRRCKENPHKMFVNRFP